MKEHACDERCKCPKCNSPLYYSKHFSQHACSNPNCKWTEHDWVFKPTTKDLEAQKELIPLINLIKKLN